MGRKVSEIGRVPQVRVCGQGRSLYSAVIAVGNHHGKIIWLLCRDEMQGVAKILTVANRKAFKTIQAREDRDLD